MTRMFAGAIALMIGLGALAGVSEAEARDQTREKRVEQSHTKKSQPKKQQAQKRHWKKGGKYTGKGSVVANYGNHKLKAPAKGYRWMRDGDEFLLVRIGSGLIVEIVGLTGR
ncbi:hypothetical protein NA8A_10843 [Nitratireductor indicus C115]|uniref:Integral membrane protein n=1 Tax=Nitratireductor indicus C115 TaxID=1231190 RepID=K2NXE0_9HYPH|nr:RcnB family protein [Nitratireductor indicus]EKF42554.1 hypothetical protein NA8A_10843 [Nitratireductor indicus C115]SFQ57281.1 Nickel/cobalt transporter regulator [Nitratireductor indicus]